MCVRLNCSRRGRFDEHARKRKQEKQIPAGNGVGVGGSGMDERGGWGGAGGEGEGVGSAQEARAKAEMVSADTAKVSPGGATFTVPAGWSIETGKDLVVLTPPE